MALSSNGPSDLAMALMAEMGLPADVKKQLFETQKAEFDRIHAEAFTMALRHAVNSDFKPKAVSESRAALLYAANRYDEQMKALAQACDVDESEIDFKANKVPGIDGIVNFLKRQTSKPAEEAPTKG